MPAPSSASAPAFLSPPSTPSPQRRTLRQLAWVAAGVVLVHALLVREAPQWLGAGVRWGDSVSPSAPMVFETRNITLPPTAPSPAPPPAPSPARPTPAKPAAQRPAPMAAVQAADAVAVVDTSPQDTASPNADTPPDAAAPVASNPDTNASANAPSAPPLPAEAALGSAAYSPPASALLKYEVQGQAKGFNYGANGELLWQHDGRNYAARLEISAFLLGSRVQTSKGAVTPQGLEPLRFGDKGGRSAEVAAHFQRDKGLVSFSANTPDAALVAGAQDQLSVFIQMAALFQADAQRWPSGSLLPFQAVGPRSAENWVFKVLGPVLLKLPGGELETIQLIREPSQAFDNQVELWLAPRLAYLPAQIKITQSNGDTAALLWRSAQNP